MNIHEYRFLLSERATLKDLIDQAPPGSIITRMGLESRLKEVQAEIESYEANSIVEHSPDVVDARLTFGGKPVIGQHGILTDFGAKALTAFEKAVASVGASQDGHLNWMGPIPNRDAYGLLITDIAHGSFGFEFKGASQYRGSTLEYSEAELAVEKVRDILEASLEATDEYELTDKVGDIHQRALKHLCEFLDIVSKNGAVCALRFGDDEVRFNDTEQVKRSAERLGRIENAENVELEGQFIGFLPNSRRAEFWIESTGEIITGPVRRSVAQFAESNVNRPVRVSARRRQIGAAKPHYTFRDIMGRYYG